MESVIEFLMKLYQMLPEIVAAVIAFLTGVIAIALLIPGEQPEKFLKKVVEFLEKYSR